MRERANALTRLLSEGKINGGGEILGLDRDPNKTGHFVPNEEELKTVRTLMRAFLKLPGKRKLLQYAQEKGITGKRGKPLLMHSITILLNNARWRYRGLWPANLHNKDLDPDFIPENKRYQEVKLSHGSLIEISLLDQVLAKLQHTHQKKLRTGFEAYTYLLSGILRSEDGTTFTGQYGKKGAYRYYYNEQRRIRLRCDLVDELVRKAVKDHFASDKRFAHMARQSLRLIEAQRPEIDARIALLEKTAGEISKAEQKIQESFSAKKLDDPAYGNWLQNQVRIFAQQRVQVERELSLLQEHKQKFLDEQGVSRFKKNIADFVHEGFDQQTPTTQRSIIEKIVPAVIVRKDLSWKFNWRPQ